jgi:DNA polymerase III alpha subunit (gram-positive type)
MPKRKILFIDLETSGLDSSIHEILEIGLQVQDDTGHGRPVYDKKVRPTRIHTAEEKALEVNGYNDWDWRAAIELEPILQILSPFMQDAVVVGWNVSFDWSFLCAAWREHNIKIPNVRLMDAMTLHYARHGQWSLNSARRKYGLPIPEIHRAYQDADDCRMIFDQLMKETRK